MVTWKIFSICVLITCFTSNVAAFVVVLRNATGPWLGSCCIRYCWQPQVLMTLVVASGLGCSLPCPCCPRFEHCVSHYLERVQVRVIETYAQGLGTTSPRAVSVSFFTFDLYVLPANGNGVCLNTKKEKSTTDECRNKWKIWTFWIGISWKNDFQWKFWKMIWYAV